MRKIESQMCAAVQSNKDWKSGNTSVHFDPETGVSIVRLHGNKIAEVSDNDMTIFDGGWQSVTTKSRLNALCDYFCVSGEGVFQKDFQWYVQESLLVQLTDKISSRLKISNLVMSLPDVIIEGLVNTFPSIITSSN